MVASFKGFTHKWIYNLLISDNKLNQTIIKSIINMSPQKNTKLQNRFKIKTVPGEMKVTLSRVRSKQQHNHRTINSEETRSTQQDFAVTSFHMLLVLFLTQQSLVPFSAFVPHGFQCTILDKYSQYLFSFILNRRITRICK